MCGRYAIKLEPQYAQLFAMRAATQPFESYNVAPTQSVPAIRMRNGKREGVMLRWGLIPSFARGVASDYRMVNARVTVPANALMRRIHNSRAVKGKRMLLSETEHRMPAILTATDQDTWLIGTTEQAFAALKPYPHEMMVAWPVSRRVNTPKTDGADLIAATDLAAALW